MVETRLYSAYIALCDMYREDIIDMDDHWQDHFKSLVNMWFTW